MASERKSLRYSRARLMSALYDYTNNYAETKGYDTNRGLAAGTAATVLGISLDKLEGRDGEDRKFEYSEAEAQLIKEMALSASEMQDVQEPSHFMDKFMERMVRNAMPNTLDAETLQMRMHDPSRTKKPPLSVRIFVSNMKQLSGKMGVLFKIQYGLIHIVTWRQPTKTLSVLVAYTCVCLWPHLVLSFPLLFVIFGLILPGYLHRHPMDTPEILPVRKRGQTLLDYFNDSEDSSLLTDILDERDRGIPDELSLVLTNTSLLSETTVGAKDKDKDEAKVKSKFLKNQVSMFMNMRDLQNLTGDLLQAMDKGEALVNDMAGFKDERLTTFIFYVVAVVTWVVLFLGRFIPWRLIFIQSGWAFFALLHPNTKKYLVKLQKTKSKIAEKTDPEASEKSEKESEKSMFDSFDREDIIVDDSPEVRNVEIYELHTRDVLRHEWKFYGYLKRFFDFRDTVRMAGTLPHGVDHLGKVMPPKEWKYDFGYANNWKIDLSPAGFIHERGVDETHLEVRAGETEGWIYDKLPVDQDNTVEFRRRRLYRECYRYSRPFRKLAIE